MSRPVIFAHGLEGSPKGTKAVYLHESVSAITPELGHLAVDAQVDTLSELLESRKESVLIGSSLGAISALGAALQAPNLIFHLILLAPAVGAHRRRDLFTEAEKRRPGLASQVERLSTACIPTQIPTTIIHGLEDEILDTSEVVALAKRSPSANLILVHSDHSLLSAKPLIQTVALRAATGKNGLLY